MRIEEEYHCGTYRRSIERRRVPDPYKPRVGHPPCILGFGKRSKPCLPASAPAVLGNPRTEALPSPNSSRSHLETERNLVAATSEPRPRHHSTRFFPKSKEKS